MPKTFKILSLVILFISNLFTLAFAQQTTDSIRFVTYYPSPYGSYAELRSKKLAVGAGYINASTLSWNTDADSFCSPGQICNADLVVEGNVGIGTAAPAEILHIYGGGLQIEDISTSGAMLNLITKGDGSKGLNNLATKGWHLVARGENYAGIPAQENDLGLWFFNGTNSESRLFIEHDTGNVGIGTTSPNSPAPGPGGTPTTGNLEVNDVYLRSVNKWASQGGGVVQVVYYQTANDASTTDLIPLDDTPPRNTEGIEVMSVSITPKKSSNILIVDALVLAGNDQAYSTIAALFKDSDVEALAVAVQDNDSVYHGTNTMNIRYCMPAGTTSPITFTVRLSAYGSTTYFNSQFGSAGISNITVTEIAS